MSQGNAETLRSFYERLNTTGEVPAELFGAFDILDDGRLLLDEVITGEVIVVTKIRRADAAHASHRGLPLTVVVGFRDGLIVRFDGYRERADALAAVGLSG
jgi:hypothetical protein